MTRAGFTSIFLMLGAACMPLETYYKENAPVDQLNRDLSACRVEALKAIPVDKETRLIPGTRSPRTACNSAGNCHTYWVQITPDRWESYDANKSARTAYTEACMGKAGYEKVRVPACDPQTAKTQASGANKVLPPLGANSCAIRLTTGQWQIVNKAP